MAVHSIIAQSAWLYTVLSRKAHGCTQYYSAKRMAVHSIIAQSAWLYTVLSRKAHGCTQYYHAKRMAVHSSRLDTKYESPFCLQAFILKVFLAAMNHFVTVETMAKRSQVPVMTIQFYRNLKSINIIFQ
jgi:sarcosine oxidase delta subunit